MSAPADENPGHAAPCTRQLQRGLNGLRFDDPALEKEFRRRYTDLNINRIRAALILAVFLVVLVAVLDLLTAPAAIRWSVGVEKLALMLPLPLLTLWVSNHPRYYRRVGKAMFAAVIMAGLLLSAIHAQMGLVGYTQPYDSILVLIPFIYFLCAMLWPWCVIAAAAVTVFSLLGDLVVGLPLPELTYHAMHLLAANLVGLVGSFMLERVSRLDYLHAGSASELADIDRVTSLRSASSFARRLERWWRKAQMRESSLGMLLIDIDYFRRFDESCGHYAAEEALRTIAQSLQDLRSGERCFLARMDDDGFAVLMRDATQQSMQTLADEVRDVIASLQLQHPDSPIANELTVTIVGLQAYPRDGQSAEAFSTDVRESLNQLKRCDRNSVWIRQWGDEPDERVLNNDKVTPLRRKGQST